MITAISKLTQIRQEHSIVRMSRDNPQEANGPRGDHFAKIPGLLGKISAVLVGIRIAAAADSDRRRRICRERSAPKCRSWELRNGSSLGKTGTGR